MYLKSLIIFSLLFCWHWSIYCLCSPSCVLDKLHLHNVNRLYQHQFCNQDSSLKYHHICFENMVLHPQFQQTSYHLASLHSKSFSISTSPITQILPPCFLWWFSASLVPSNILLALFLLQDLSSKPKAILCEGRCNLVVFYLVITGLSRLQVINGFLIFYLVQEMAVLK